MKSHLPMHQIDVVALGSGTEPSAHARALQLPPGQSAAAAGAESEELARFEGEGGLTASELAAPHRKERMGQ